MRLGLILGIALILIGLFAGSTSAQQQPDRCTVAQWDLARDQAKNALKEQEAAFRFQDEVRRALGDQSKIKRAQEDFYRVQQDVQRSNLELAKRAQEECQRAQQDSQRNKDYRDAMQQRDPFQRR